MSVKRAFESRARWFATLLIATLVACGGGGGGLDPILGTPQVGVVVPGTPTSPPPTTPGVVPVVDPVVPPPVAGVAPVVTTTVPVAAPPVNRTGFRRGQLV